MVGLGHLKVTTSCFFRQLIYQLFLRMVSIMMQLKGHSVVFGQEIHTLNFNIHNINEIIIQTCFHKCINRLLEARKVAGSATYKHSKTV